MSCFLVNLNAAVCFSFTCIYVRQTCINYKCSRISGHSHNNDPKLIQHITSIINTINFKSAIQFCKLLY